VLASLTFKEEKMQSTINKSLLVAAICCFMAALAHLGCIVFGGDWYRFFGAGEQMARMAEQGLWYPTIVTSVIVLVLLVWALYGLSGAGAIKPLPLTKIGKRPAITGRCSNLSVRLIFSGHLVS
jgi:Mg/Co/Ni transporter MgtE